MTKVTTLILILFITLTSLAQITINRDDYFLLGNPGDTTHYWETFNATLDMGSYGETSWDFSELTYESSVFVEFRTPENTPFFSRYSLATLSVLQAVTGDFPTDIYAYVSSTDSSIMFYGESINDNSGSMHITHIPPKEMFFPLSFDSSWTYDGVERFEFDGDQDDTPITINNGVISYGELTFPGGKMANALLFRSEEIRDFDGFIDTMKTFIFLTDAQDAVIMWVGPGQADTGDVDIASAMWFENTLTDVINENAVVKGYQLKQNYPNPFNPTTIIEYSIPEASKVELKIYNSLGKEITTLVNEFKPAGAYEVKFNAADLASGIYFARFQSGDYSQSIKLTLLK